MLSQKNQNFRSNWNQVVAKAKRIVCGISTVTAPLRVRNWVVARGKWSVNYTTERNNKTTIFSLGRFVGRSHHLRLFTRVIMMHDASKGWEWTPAYIEDCCRVTCLPHLLNRTIRWSIILYLGLYAISDFEVIQNKHHLYSHVLRKLRWHAGTGKCGNAVKNFIPFFAKKYFFVS